VEDRKPREFQASLLHFSFVHAPSHENTQGKKRRDTVCIVLTDDTVDESRIRYGLSEEQ